MAFLTNTAGSPQVQSSEPGDESRATNDEDRDELYQPQVDL
jgi:hypothetical protein